MPVMLFLGFGYTAERLSPRLLAQGWRVIGSVRGADKAERIAALGVEPVLFDGQTSSADLAGAIGMATHAIQSIPPGEGGDPVLRHHGDALRASGTLGWVAYLSTIGVYGDHGGAWIDETAELRPTQPRAKRRVIAERAWLDLAAATGGTAMVFRLAGIYGPGRSQIDQLRRGTARRIIREGQVFNRIHVDDIATVLAAAIEKPAPGGIYNLSDDHPSPPQDVVTYAADLLGVAPPPEIPFDEADLSPMGRGFYSEIKRTCNNRMKADFGVSLTFPDYRAGLRAILEGAPDAEG